ncbi:polysaccharide deacetylase [Nitratidesulfovibrio termitidis]|uniref:polysaccharide deacetylase n=1 Tax=Nitratidesulfovibrio termitidis TaxID=42252 RepID=UPI0005526439|nr:polysaccharide deacetylase [Nitratidesulfovibrio termitidis]
MSVCGCRFALLTVDTEALPKRASGEHVRHLVWGQHARGTAGIREMCAIGDEVNARHVFFVDVCGAHAYQDEIRDVVRWLDVAGQDVQLHAHPEYLPEDFWKPHGFRYRPRFMNQYGPEKALFVVSHFGRFISDVTGKPLRAFRAGSFRWNASTIRALKGAGIALSFNGSMNAFANGLSTYGEPTPHPYRWSNGVIEVPATERLFNPVVCRNWWGRLQFPVSHRFRNPPWRILWPHTLGRDSSFLVLLLHSWSLLYWDENGHGVYRDDKRLEDYRKLVRRLAKDYDIITTADFLDLHAHGKITTTRTVDLARAELPQ